jgi:hypothetical protein
MKKISNTTMDSGEATKSMQYMSEFYDKNAGALYGTILRIVDKEIIAVKVLEGTFKGVFVNGNIKGPKLVSEFTAISNYARKKSLDTLKAIRIFQACNESRECVSCAKSVDS